ncbi:hypothetical protein [Serratia sp. Se-RSBMAAmG]|uniref:hypothetical protein n=1 Tax=Serratia sp. Se-RSBMAAmG TaxID=3043305 RepID=UPI0024AF4947|nr:hypothetical protein [Serratia sp. Se-RSBMAAmG]MDI6977273.1 hypothetical protein [Serratia sp. Se-RSBMAAmG]
MQQKSDVMKKLNGKLRVLKRNPLFKFKEFNSSAARHENKSEKDDYVLILNLQDGSRDSLAISVNYKGKTEEDATVVVSRAKAVYDPLNGFYGAYRSEGIVRSEPLSFDEFSLLLNGFNRVLQAPEFEKKNVVRDFCDLMEVDGPEEIVMSRPKMR